jgi:hypothetical protein
MKMLHGLPMVLLLTALCAAQEHSQVDLQSKADQARGVECAQLSMQAAQHLLEDADRLFSNGGVEAAHGAIDAALHYVRRSVDCTLQVRKHEKASEIEIRELIRRMNDVRRTLDSEDRPHLSRALTELDEQRDRLLMSLFGPAAAARGNAP